MGGCAGITKDRHAKYAPEIFSNRHIINQLEMPPHQNSININACGYGFDADQIETQNIKKQQISKNKQKQLQNLDKLQILRSILNKQYNEHKIDHCIKTVDKLQSILKTINYELIKEEIKQDEIKDLTDFINLIKQEYSDIISFEKQIKRSGWLFKSQNDGIRMSSRRQLDTVGVIIQTIIDVPAEIMLSVATQIDLYCKFVPFMQISKCDKDISRNHKIGYCVNNFPLLSRREAFFQGIGYNMLQHSNCLYLYTRSLHNRPDLCKRYNYQPNINPQYVQIQYKYLVLKYEPIDRQKGKIIMAINIDMKINFLPISILDYCSQSFGEDFFKNIFKITKNYKNSIWQEKIKRNSTAYQFFKNSLSQYFELKDVL